MGSDRHIVCEDLTLLREDAKLLGVDAGVLQMFAFSPLYASGDDTRLGERVLTLKQYRQLTRLKGKIAKELKNWKRKTAEMRKLIATKRGCAPSRRTMVYAEHLEWMKMESLIAPEVWGMLENRLQQRVRFERYRLKCSAIDRILKALFPVAVSS